MGRFLAFFSGFPERRFPSNVAERLNRELARRDSLVFVSAWPEDHERNDDDSEGMYRMFLEYGMEFERHAVIDTRMEASRAVKLIRGASCIFLMGGHPEEQRRMLREMGLDDAVRESNAAVLGVSAGSINMAVRSLDTKESPVPYAGLGLADVTVKPHFDPMDEGLCRELLEISEELPICATEDNSAIFVAEDGVSFLGHVHWIDKGTRQRFCAPVCDMLNKRLADGKC